MKKLKYLVMMLLATVVVTGCGSGKTLTCTKTEESSGLKMEQTVTVKFKDDKVSHVKLSMNNEATSELIKQNWDLFVTTLDSQFASFKESEGLNVKTKNNKDKYSYYLELEVDVNKVDGSEMGSLGLDFDSDDDSSYSEVKESLKEEGYACK